jgi:uncharacterized membrane protein
MKKFLNHVRDKVFSGLMFLVPIFAVILILQKLWTVLHGAGNYLSKLFGLPVVFGKYSATAATALLLVLLFYFFSWLVRFSSLTKMRDWIENSLLQYIPGYLNYKAQIQEKIGAKQDNRKPVWVTTITGKRPGLLIEEQAGQGIVYFPNSPDSNNGQVLMVSMQLVTKLNLSAGSFIKSLQKFGKDLPLLNIESTADEKKKPAVIEPH